MESSYGNLCLNLSPNLMEDSPNFVDLRRLQVCVCGLLLECIFFLQKRRKITILILNLKTFCIEIIMLEIIVEISKFHSKVCTFAISRRFPDKRIDQGCWLRSGFKSPRRQPCFKPLSGSYQLWTLHRSNIISALLGLRANKLNPFSIFFQAITKYIYVT